MFSQVFVCPQGGLCPGGSLSRGVSVQGVSVQGVSVQGVSVQGPLSGGGLCPGESLSEGSCTGGLCPGGSLSGRPPVWLRAGSTHPTGMHSCYIYPHPQNYHFCF